MNQRRGRIQRRGRLLLEICSRARPGTSIKRRLDFGLRLASIAVLSIPFRGRNGGPAQRAGSSKNGSFDAIDCIH